MGHRGTHRREDQIVTTTPPALLERRATPRGLRPGLAILVDAVAFESRETPESAGAIAYSVFEGIEVIGSGPHVEMLRRLFDVLEAFPATHAQAWRAVILANLFAVATRGSATDYEQAATLARLGPRHAASVQGDLDHLVRAGDHRPLTTTAVLRLSNRARIRTELLLAGRGIDVASRIADECAAAAFRLLLVGIDSTRPDPIPSTAQHFRAVVEQHGVNGWRGLLANVPAHPWGPAVAQLEALAAEADLPDALLAIQECSRIYRKRMEDDERLAVAREIRRLVRKSGCTQRMFATYVGTSASRMSTYVNGIVVPSSTMLLRMQKMASVLAEEAAPAG
jgi:DNA-binding transcriptional regulator YiaG